MKDAEKARAIMRALISAASTTQFGEIPGACKRLFAGVVSAGILLTPAHAADVELLPSPAAENSSLSRVVSDESGNLYLSWVTQTENSDSLYYSILNETRWSEPQLVSRGEDWFINWADFPVLSVSAENKAAHWLRMSAEGTYDYDIDARFYDAQTDLWSDTITPHKDGVSAEHGFVSMLPVGNGNTLMSWLDGRNTKTVAGYGEMTLRAGIFNARGETLSEWELDDRVCDCCQTSAAMSAAGPVIVYRDRSAGEIRDIYITRYANGDWTPPVAIHDDQWEIAGCPVNGPSVAAQGDFVAVGWFTAKDDSPKVQLALSTDSGEHFSAPIRVSGPDTIGRIDTAILANGQVAVSWLDTSAETAQLTVSRFSAGGSLIDTTVVARTSASRRSGFPIMETIGDDLFVTWTDISEGPEVRVARVDFASP